MTGDCPTFWVHFIPCHTVDMDDTTFVTNIILGVEDAIEAADVNNDGKVSMPDAMFIVNKMLKGKFPDE